MMKENQNAWGNDIVSDFRYPWESVMKFQNFIFDFVSSSLSGYYNVAIVCAVFALIYYFLFRPLDFVYDYTDIGYQHLNESRIKRNTTKQQLVAEVQRRRHFGNAPPAFPNGWFAILESSDLKANQVKHVQAIGENFAVMRSSKGEAHVLDAYCPHLGANMAVGGVVRGDCLECPFHGWQFRGEDGTCSHVPYSNKVPTAAKVRKWDSCEVNDWIFVWYHVEGVPPTWQVECNAKLENGDIWLAGRSEFRANYHVQENLENVADFAHMVTVHGPGLFAGGELWRQRRLWGWLMRLSYKLQWEEHKEEGQEHRCTLTIQQNFRLMKWCFLIPGRNVVVSMFGPGLIYIFNGSIFTTMMITPLESFHTRVVIRTYSPPLLTLPTRLLHLGEAMMIKRDILLFNQKKYLEHPQLVKEDKTIARLRQWYKQFYSSNQATRPAPQNVLEW